MMTGRLVDALGSRMWSRAAFGCSAALGVLLTVGHLDLLAAAARLDTRDGGLYTDGLFTTLLLLTLTGLIFGGLHAKRMSVEIACRKTAEAGANERAQLDPLTGLPNRLVLHASIDKALADIWPGLEVAILLIDLDGFKEVNDVYGHTAGDEVLRLAAQRMKAALTFGTLLARLAGDEFAVFIPYSLRHRAALEADAIVSVLETEFRVADALISIGASVGIAAAPVDASNAEALLAAADQAMYRAKQAGGSRVEVFDALMAEQAREAAGLRAQLRSAIASGQIVPYYQPIVDLRSGRIVELEVLARWEHPVHGVLPPARFIHLVERSRQATAMLVSLLDRVGADASQWTRSLRFSLNIFPGQLLETQLIERLSATARSRDLSTSRLCLEITENAMIRNVRAARNVMDAAHRDGMTIALDDVGTGYSSLHHLRVLPFDRIKIDRSFVQSIPEDAANATFADALISIGKKLGLEVVAEGIETLALDRLLAGMECDYGQGFIYSKPVPPNEVAALLEANAVSSSMVVMPLRRQQRPTPAFQLDLVSAREI